MTLFLLVAIDLAYLSWAEPLAAFVPAPVSPGVVGLALFALNAAVLARPAIDASWNRALVAPLGSADAIVRRLGPGRLLAVIVAAALGLRMLVVARETIDVTRAEMLPLMMRAMERLLAGANPYVVYQLPHPMPLTYLPWLWLPMVPVFSIGVDVRLSQAVAACGAGMVIALAPWGNDASLGRSPAVRLALAAGFLLCPATFAFVAIGHTAFYWLYLAGLFAALVAGRWFLAGVCAGLAVMARQFFWPAVVPVGLLVWRAADPAGRRRFALGALLPIASAWAVFAADPVFALWDNVRWYAAFDPFDGKSRPWWALNNPGFASLLYPLGLIGLLRPLAAIAVALALIHAWRRVIDARTAAASVALVLLAVTLTAPAPFRYEFLPVVIAVTAVALLSPLEVAGRVAPLAEAGREARWTG